MEDVKNLSELTQDLLRTYNAIKRDEIPLDKARELHNFAGKVIQGAAQQLEYTRRRREIPDLPHLK